ncbi:AAA family ATPase [Defluviimonas sp. WL0002]|uniref:AAA family ATPase n=1 Tax=Albidovulum marisflavi TaxID=2984159 RepID=A0ABT2Z8M7_9RHOB|nr:AAA family ATPase [Defluviimonas sp. WL0002]MCV2867438.1 AAA family ATPase [Defluviimonas sp. WL0002]
MAYKISQLDKKNFNWFESDNTRASLCSISLEKGHIRGLTEFSVEFRYPITVFSGGNGSGKSTMLALAACAFHNERKGFIPPLRNKSYYTFHDFFVQSSAESPVDGVNIYYAIRHNNWKGAKPGLQRQSRNKKKGGKWNDYDSRVRRNVIYFGVQRVVPHYERSTHKSYRSKFKPGKMGEPDRKMIAEIAGRIVGKPYADFDAYVHTKYTLPVASVNGITYSGFNMGAGEGSVFEILSALFAAGEGALLVVDEIELGLHEQAQVRLIHELKKLCYKLKCQIICSTHSYSVLRSVPPEARFHIENVLGKTFITSGASAEFACGKMGRPDAHELDVFVEDRVAVEIIQSVLPASLRKRVRLKSIGSHSAVIRQLSSRRLEDIHNCICVLDGDQNGEIDNAVKVAQAACEVSTEVEKNDVKSWILDRVFYLPGGVWPEKWIVEQAQAIVSDLKDGRAEELANNWGIADRAVLAECLNEAAAAEKHSEFRDLALAVDLSEEKARMDLISFVVKAHENEFKAIIDGVAKNLL